jgi:hypothetical protein
MKTLRFGTALCLLVSSTVMAGPSFAAGFLNLTTNSVRPLSSFSTDAPPVSPKTTLQSGQKISDCYPFHRIANDFDYCTGTPVLH